MPHYKTVNQGDPGIVALSIANKHYPLTSSPAGMDSKSIIVSLMDKNNQEFIAHYVMPCEEKAKIEAEKNQTITHTLNADSGSAAGAVGIGGGAYSGRDLTAFVWLLWIKNTQSKDKK